VEGAKDLVVSLDIFSYYHAKLIKYGRQGRLHPCMPVVHHCRASCPIVHRRATTNRPCIHLCLICLLAICRRVIRRRVNHSHVNRPRVNHCRVQYCRPSSTRRRRATQRLSVFNVFGPSNSGQELQFRVRLDIRMPCARDTRVS